MHIAGNSTFDQLLTVNGTFTSTSQANFSNLGAGSITSANELTSNGDLHVQNTSYLNVANINQLNASSILDLGDLNIQGNGTFNQLLTVNGTFTSTSQANFNNLGASSITTTQLNSIGDLNVQNTSNLNVANVNQLSANSIFDNGDLNIQGNGNFNQSLTVSGDLTDNGTIHGNWIVANYFVSNADVTVGGTLKANNGIDVAGSSTFHSDLTVNGNANLNIVNATSVTTNSIQIPTGAVAGYVLTSDANGNASWMQNSSGSIGAVGPTGPTGPQGDVGPQGPPGNDGQQGPPGMDGYNGMDGQPGPIGPTGTFDVAGSQNQTLYYDGGSWVATSDVTAGSGVVTIANQFYVNGNSYLNNVNTGDLVANSLTSNYDLNVNGNAYFNGLTSNNIYSNYLNLNNDLQVNGNSNFGNVNANNISTNFLSLGNDLQVNGNSNLNDVYANNVNSNYLSLYNDLQVNGTSNLNAVNANYINSSFLTLSSDLQVNGNSNLNTVNASTVNTSNLILPGGGPGYFLTTDGNGNTSWSLISSASLMFDQTYKEGNTAVVGGIVRNLGLEHKNVGFGPNADVLSSDIENATAIGANAKVGVKNGIALGDSNLALVGIGTGYPTARLDVRGSFKLVDGTEGAGKVLVSDQNGNASWTNLPEATIASNFTKSDSTLKTNIQPTTYGLAALMQLRPVNFTWKENGTNDVGFIAQEVKLVIPELVHGKQGSYAISYGQLSAVITQAVQEQQKVIEAQQVAINALTQKVEQLSNLLNQKK